MACEAKSVSLHPASLSDDARAEIFLNDVTVEGPAGPNLRNDKKIGEILADLHLLSCIILQYTILFYIICASSKRLACS